jgi:hypothetical protein
MFTVAVNLPTEKFAAMQAQLANLAQPDGPLDAVGSYVSSIGMPGYFRAGGDGWAPVKRGGTPLIDTTALVSGFIYDMGSDGKSVVITNTGREPMVQEVLNFGAEIHATNAPYLTFKIGDSWVKKKSVTIPARQFWLWFSDLVTQSVAIAQQRLLENIQKVLA